MATWHGHGSGRWHRELAAGFVAQVLLLTLLAATMGLGSLGWLAGAMYAVLSNTLLGLAVRRSGMGALGPANRITVARMTLAGGVLALVVDGSDAGVPVGGVIVLAAVALALDAVDGRIARHTGTVSQLGARFDMEVDAFLILVLSILVARSLGPWVLVIGAMRYAFMASAHLMPWLRAPLPPSFARKTVAAVQGIVLVVASTPAVPHRAALALTAVALVLLVWSFARDIVWLWRRRPRRYSQLSRGTTTTTNVLDRQPQERPDSDRGAGAPSAPTSRA